MAITFTDNRVTIDQADSTTGWTGGSPTVITTTFAESTASIGDTLNIATGDLFFTTTAIDLSDSLIYVRSQNQALQGAWTGGVHALFLGDGTDQIAFHQAGNDRETFKHNETEVFFQSFVLDGAFAATKDAAGETTAVAGSFANLNLGAITEIGSHFITLSKALGGGQNVFVDIIRHDETGHRGFTVTGGTPADPGTFDDCAAADRSTADGAGHGIIREYTPGVYGLQGTIRFGANPGQDSDTFFVANNEVLVFEDRDIDDDKYWFYVQGAANNVVFYLQNVTVTTAGPEVRTFLSDAGINELDIQGSTFASLGRPIEFANDSLNAPHHNVVGNTFNAVGMIDPGTVKFRNNTISSPADKLGGLLIDADGTDNIESLSFLSDGTGHGFYVNTPGSYTLTEWTYDGFGADDTEDAVVFNDSKGSVTLTISGGDTPTVRNGAGSTTTLLASVPIEVNGVNEGAQCYMEADGITGPLSAGTEVFNEAANSSGVAAGNFTGTTPQGVVVKARSSGTIAAAISDDGGTQTDETAVARSGATTNDVNLMPGGATNDRYYFGGVDKFDTIKFIIGTIGAGAYTLNWEYWNGAWTSLTVTDTTNDFKNTAGRVTLTAPGDWTTTSVNGQGPYYYVRCTGDGGGQTTAPLGNTVSIAGEDTVKYLPFETTGTIASGSGLTVTAVWLPDIIAGG